MNWFQAALQQAFPPGRGAVSNLARMLDEPRETVDRWYSGIFPDDPERIERALKKLGGDIARALPSYKAEAREKGFSLSYESSPSYHIEGAPDPKAVFIYGQVSAGRVSFAGEDQHFKSIDTFWADSRYWSLTHGDVIFLEVHGESMAPDYVSGEVLACRAPVSSADLPNGTPCIFSESEEEFTFKLLRKAKDNMIVGQPINPTYDFVIFNQQELRIPLVVLGKVQLERSIINHAMVTKPKGKKPVK